MSVYLGSNCFVSGANRGLGLGFVRHLLKTSEVRRIFAGTRNPDESKELQDLANENDKIKIVQFDLLDDQSIHSAVKTVEEAVGDEGISLLVNNAGLFHADGNDSSNPERDAVLKVFNTNVVGIMIASPAFLPLLKRASTSDRPSRILNVSSGAGSVQKLNGAPFPFSNATYPASKAALNSYTKFFATCDYSKGLIVVALCPGWVQTDMGGQRAELTVDQSITAVLKTVSGLKTEDSGRYINRFGETIPTNYCTRF